MAKLENAKLENYTPHKITVMDKNKQVLFDLPSLGNARCRHNFEVMERLTYDNHEVTIQQGEFGATSGLPEPKENTRYVVSRIVAEANEDRTDLLMVFGTVRDDQKRIIGCCGFSRLRRGEMEMLRDKLLHNSSWHVQGADAVA
tara:strand:+ start:343 stop:774 length:432 start_codon:yes stop_codon:yes gene_type:complete